MHRCRRPCSAAAAETDGTFVYVFGGYHFPAAVGSTLNTVYRYNIATNTWTTLSTTAPMPQAALVPSAVYYPPTNKIYVFGGSTRTPDPIVIYDVTRIYDIATNTWTMGATMPGPRSQMASGYNPANGKIYLNGGYSARRHRHRLEPDLGVRPDREHVHRQGAEPD